MNRLDQSTISGHHIDTPRHRTHEVWRTMNADRRGKVLRKRPTWLASPNWGRPIYNAGQSVYNLTCPAMSNWS